VSDDAVHAALRSGARLVAIEAPAGCGKTHQGAEYAKDVAITQAAGRPLILTHTHAACSVFAERTRGSAARVDICTIDSLVGQIASAYHAGLGLPADTATWARRTENGHAELASKVAALMRRHAMVADAVASRHPVVICDEHQDTSRDQHSIIKAMQARGTVFWQCNVALGAIVQELAQATQMPAPDVRTELVAGLNPGVRLVPSHVMALGIAQEHGFTYMKP
jgi:DNA helicase-2/ATP-dependent DNA helicase PcrA